MTTSELPALLVRLVAFVFGATWGSFFNVAVHRWPRGQSVVSPPSTCPACGARIPPWRNVPIVSWLALRGRAACCGARISPRYVVIEAVSGALCVAIAERVVVGAPEGSDAGLAALEALAWFAFGGALLVATFVDLEHMEIPDEVSLPGAALGLVTADMRGSPGAAAAALGAGGGFLLVQLLFVHVYERFTGRRGMGEGDAKLLMLIGAWIGWQGAVFALVAGAAQGLVAAAALLLTGRDTVPEAVREREREDAAATGAQDGTRGGDADAAAPERSGEAPWPGEAPRSGDATRDPSQEAPEGDDARGDPVDDEPAPSGQGALRVPFGPFLALGALEFYFFGDAILSAYVDLVGL